MNIEFMEEKQLLENMRKQPKRSRRAIKWLMNELDTAINEDVVLLKKCIHFEDFTRAYRVAQRLSPALDIINNEQVKEVIQTILKEGKHGDTGIDSATGSQDQVENRTVRKNRPKKRHR